jgi:hypothetical protein
MVEEENDQRKRKGRGGNLVFFHSWSMMASSASHIIKNSKKVPTSSLYVKCVRNILRMIFKEVPTKIMANS